MRCVPGSALRPGVAPRLEACVKRAIGLLFAIALIALAASPVAAQTRVETLPEITPANTSRFDFALIGFGELLAYGKGEVESANRIHLTLKTVPFEGQPSETVEAIIYDGVYYTRENESTQWYIEGEVAAPLPEDQLPVAESEDVTLTLIGEANVAGVPAYQYQFWVNGEDGSVTTADFFIGRSPSYLHKLVISGYLSGEDTIPLIGLDYRYYDFNADIKVSAPQGAIARPASASTSLAGMIKQGVFQASAMARWAR
jgi:hypothetical protein